MGFQWGEKPGFLYGTGFLDDKKWQQLCYIMSSPPPLRNIIFDDFKRGAVRARPQAWSWMTWKTSYSQLFQRLEQKRIAKAELDNPLESAPAGWHFKRISTIPLKKNTIQIAR